MQYMQLWPLWPTWCGTVPISNPMVNTGKEGDMSNSKEIGRIAEVATLAVERGCLGGFHAGQDGRPRGKYESIN